MRRLVIPLLVAALLPSGCAAVRPAARTPAPLAVFELARTRGDVTDATLAVVDTASGARVATLPLGRVVAVSDVVTATGVPKLVVASEDAFREVDLDTSRAETLAVASPGLRPAGVGHTIDGNPVLWELSRDGALVEVYEIAGATVRVARADLGVPAAGAPQNAERRVAGPLMLMAADDAQAVLVAAHRVGGTGAAWARAVFRADFHAETIAQLSPAAPWPAGLALDAGTRVGEAVRRWGVPGADARGAGFFGLDGARRAVIDDDALRRADSVVFQPGGETFLAVERSSALATRPIADPPVKVVERSMYGAESRAVLARSSGVLVPVGVANGLVAYTRRPPGTLGGVFELRVAPAGEGSETVAASVPLGADEGMHAVYLGTYEPRRRP